MEQEKREALTSFEVAQAELNKLSKEIGTLFQQGKTDLANELKAKTIDLKNKSEFLVKNPMI